MTKKEAEKAIEEGTWLVCDGFGGRLLVRCTDVYDDWCDILSKGVISWARPLDQVSVATAKDILELSDD